jgi:hypothetical protein
MKKLWKKFREWLAKRKISIIIDELTELLKYEILFEPNDHNTRNKAMEKAVLFLKSKKCIDPNVMITENENSESGVDIHISFHYKGEIYFSFMEMDRAEV